MTRIGTSMSYASSTYKLVVGASLLLVLVLQACNNRCVVEGFQLGPYISRMPAFATTTTTTTRNKLISSSSSSSSTKISMGMERIEFTIHPDGRVEELVLGVKGDNCVKLTAELNEKLGTVIDTKPTEELYEQEVVVVNQQSINIGTTSDGTTNNFGASW